MPSSPLSSTLGTLDTPNEGSPMMTDSTTNVPWKSLRRRTVHRTGALTDALVRDATRELGIGRPFMPNVDAVLLAALRLTPYHSLRTEVERIEAALYVVEGDTVREVKPGRGGR